MAWIRDGELGKATVGVLGLLALLGILLTTGAAGASAPGAAAPMAQHYALPPHAVAPAALSHPASTGTVAFNFSTSRILPSWSSPGQIFFNFTVTTYLAPISNYSNASVEAIAETGFTQPYTFIPFASWPIAIPPVVTATGLENNTTLSTNDSSGNVLPHTDAWVSPAGTWLANGRYLFVIFFYTTGETGNTVGGSVITGNTSGHGVTAIDVGASHPYWMSVSSPGNGASISPGRSTVVASYGGDFLLSADVNITNPDGDAVLGSNLTSLALTEPSWQENHTEVATTSAAFITLGEYSVKLTEVYTTPSGSAATSTWAQTFNVTNSTSITEPIWINTTTYHNTTGASGKLVGGLSPGAGAALLSVVGVIIGLIVGMLLSRMMGAPAAASPAQPWSGTKPSNECSICHQSFPTEAELKDHQKSAHGM